MSFNSRESSRQLGDKFEVFLFVYGSQPDAYYAYTNAERAVAFTLEAEPDRGLITFNPATIKRGRITSSGSRDKKNLEIRTAFDLGVATRFLQYPPSQVVTLRIWEGHVGEAEIRLSWVGRVLGGGLEGDEAVLTCQTASSALKRAGGGRNYQRDCSYNVYDPDTCKADRAANTITVSVVGTDQALLDLPEAWETPEQKPEYANGLAEWTTPEGLLERRTIIRSVSATRLILDGPILGLPNGSQVSLSKGCSNTEAGCRKFNNILNYGGESAIPYKNPIGSSQNY